MSEIYDEMSATQEDNYPTTYKRNRLEIQEQNEQPDTMYAGFWQRVSATIIDCILWIIFIVAIVLFLPIDERAYGLIGLFLAWMYYALLDSSTWQGTIGKTAMNIIVCDKNGDRISFLRATARYYFHLLSNLTMLIGYLMVAVTEKKQALHDMASGCVVQIKNTR
ncbi:RDD family protein [Virgibacillus alimentarius]|uniref:RDD family protein n=1 Tax=Virgibacillus alimentarius TaxID=698769 RepID=UPI000690DE69|nr:RDD family protein [Virgibacillus alimentarius]